MITRAYSKSSNSSGFNPILQDFCIMICEIIVYKTVSGIFLIFCRSGFINSFIVRSNFWESQNHRNLNVSRPIYLEKNFALGFEIISAQISCKNFFFQTFFFQGQSFFQDCKTTDLGLIFFQEEIILYFFFQVWLFNFNTILKTLRIYLEKLKNWRFYSFK